MLVNDVIVFTLIHVVANGRPSEKFDEVFKIDKEASIFFILAIDLLTRFDRPEGAFIAPSSVPLLPSVRVTNLDQTVLLAIIRHHDFNFD